MGSRRLRNSTITTALQTNFITAASQLIVPLALPPICFDRGCQQSADQLFAVAITIPVVVAVVAISYLLRPVPKDLKASGKVFEDPATGIVFDPPDGQQPLRDSKGELAFRAISYTPWPVEDGYDGERIRLDVGPLNNRQPRTFVFNHVLGRSSEILAVTLPRPLGVVFEKQEATGRIVVVGFVPGGNAERARKVASLDRRMLRDCLVEGDVLRAVTTTNIVYPTDALFGMKPAQRHVVVYGADKQKFSAAMDAVRDIQGERSMPATLVVERFAGSD